MKVRSVGHDGWRFLVAFEDGRLVEINTPPVIDERPAMFYTGAVAQVLETRGMDGEIGRAPAHCYSENAYTSRKPK